MLSERAGQLYEKVAPHVPWDLASLAVGLLLLLYGGSYANLVAAVEAFRMTGWDQTRAALATLYKYDGPLHDVRTPVILHPSE
eukprot:scaffold565_cov358-Prasinococcus_capsulatus_cf.AAC.8